MTRILIHSTKSSPSLETEHIFDKIICVPNTPDIVATVDYLQQQDEDYEIHISTELTSLFSANHGFKTITLPHTIQQELNCPKVAFYAQSDTLAHTTCNILDEIGSKIIFQIFTPVYNDERASNLFDKKAYPNCPFNRRKLQKFAPDYLLLFNDWTKEAKRILSICTSLKIKTICLQESIIDFGSKNRMQYTDNVFMQGIQSIIDLNRKHFFLTGNPRYEKLKSPLPTHKALINSNFTYGIFEEWRDRWIDSVVSCLKKSTIDFAISQHPRDTGNLARYKTKLISSSSSSINEQIANTSFTITRFSSLIHESLLHYRPVIYHNPHGEKLQYHFDFNNTFLFYTQTTTELSQAIEKIKELDIEQVEEDIDDYLQCHCLPKTGNASTNILEILKSNTLRTRKMGLKHLVARYLYNPLFLSHYFNLKKLLFRR